jgi:1-acyl-sn-glycerol-3-phosphate acyltransferase
MAMVPGSSVMRALLRASIYGLWTPLAMAIQGVLMLLPLPSAQSWFPRFYHRSVWPLLGFDVRVDGRPTMLRPVLFVSNHISYLDITVLGGLLRGSFVAKAEVSDWPLFGVLAKLSRTVFVDRRRASTDKQRDALQARLAAGDGLIMFAEATTSDGNRLLPFKTPLFSVVEQAGDRPPLVQPISLAYTRLDGMPIGRTWRPFFAWYGAMTLGGHLWQVMQLGTIRIDVICHEPVDPRAFPGRKALAQHCHQVVAAGMARSLRGDSRLPLPGSTPGDTSELAA